jgi:hypothetical protein
MITLSDDELDAVMRAAQPLRASDRDQFLRALAFELEKHTDIGPGLVHRVIRDLQKRYFDPPTLSGMVHHAGKYG